MSFRLPAFTLINLNMYFEGSGREEPRGVNDIVYRKNMIRGESQILAAKTMREIEDCDVSSKEFRLFGNRVSCEIISLEYRYVNLWGGKFQPR